MKTLVAIANYGTKNDQYLLKVLAEYRSFSFPIDIVILSNVRKEVPEGIELIVGLPDKNPWSLPFGHKRLFAERKDNYDLFIYSEDDILITETNVRRFLADTKLLADDEVPGFLRIEVKENGDRFFCDVHSSFRWDPKFTRKRGSQTFGFFSNEHSACYLLTQAQLRKAIDSGNFLVPPHEGRYDLLCSAATDPYTQCGFLKLINVTHIDQASVHHLSNRYIGQMGLSADAFQKQLDLLVGLNGDGLVAEPLFPLEPRTLHAKWAKSLYEPVRPELIQLIPGTNHRVLSIGCGWGAIEEDLQTRGMAVTAIPADDLVAAAAGKSGVRLVKGGLHSALKQLSGEKFDTVILSNILHLLPDPVEILTKLKAFLSEEGVVVASAPNLSRSSMLYHRLAGHRHYQKLGNFAKTGLQITNRRSIHKWFQQSGMAVDRFDFLVGGRGAVVNQVFGKISNSFSAWDILVRARLKN